MHNLGLTRSANRPDHILQTPDTFVRAPLPGMRNANAIVHIAPARGAAFTQYTVEFADHGEWQQSPSQTFVYMLEGELTLAFPSGEHKLLAHHYAYIPPQSRARITSESPARAAFFEKPFEPLADAMPLYFAGDETKVIPTHLMGDEALEVRTLFPADTAYDFAVNTMAYLPGASLSMVEIHVMEHGLLMLEGEGIYRLGDQWYPVKAGDFIWMAPYCPQWFGALGKKSSKYLIYKDWNRHPK
jgi:(S)-ureidoglycine aminohydrolase